MNSVIMLGDVAHCRFGDKGDTGLFVVVPYAAEDFDALAITLTPARIATHFGNMPANAVQCHVCRELGALVIVVRSTLRGGVTASLALDAHGKTRSGYLLGMLIPWDNYTQ